MRLLSITGLVLGLLALLTGLYLQFFLAPAVDLLESSTLENATAIWAEKQAFKTNLGIIVLLCGGVGVMITIVPAIRCRNVLSVSGLLVSLAAFFLGAAQGTDLFS